MGLFLTSFEKSKRSSSVSLSDILYISASSSPILCFFLSLFLLLSLSLSLSPPPPPPPPSLPPFLFISNNNSYLKYMHIFLQMFYTLCESVQTIINFDHDIAKFSLWSHDSLFSLTTLISWGLMLWTEHSKTRNMIYSNTHTFPQPLRRTFVKLWRGFEWLIE